MGGPKPKGATIFLEREGRLGTKRIKKTDASGVWGGKPISLQGAKNKHRGYHKKATIIGGMLGKGENTWMTKKHWYGFSIRKKKTGQRGKRRKITAK